MDKKRLKHFVYTIRSMLPLVNTFTGKRCIEKRGALLYRCKIYNNGDNNHILIEPGCDLKKCLIEVHGSNNRIEIKKGVNANEMHIFIEDNGNEIIIGHNTILAGTIHLACTEGKKIHIGNNCLFSSEITIRTGDSHSIINMDGMRINKAKDVTIGNHVWCGHRVIMTKGTYIPNNCIIGTGALVTKAFNKEYCIIAGNPGTIVKQDVNWEYQRI